MEAVTFQTIDLERTADRCIAFRADSYRASFGSDERFWEESGSDGGGYLTWLRQRISEFPAGCVHVWQSGRIVGQIDSRLRQEPYRHGYVNLYYLIPELRGTGVGPVLDEYTTRLFVANGCQTARLCVSPENERAVRFYQKCGWEDLGPRPDQPHVHYMEKRFTPEG